LKRLIDIILSLIGIAIALPFFPFIALFIKLDSKGPVLYLATRIGKDLQRFKMYKFRTMFDTPSEVGPSVCPQYDPRVTFLGRFLRRTKMNELPQFFNILKGDMTFVGPRPEAPDLAELYPQEAKRVFSVKPGLVGPSTILGRNEEECYPPGVDVKKYYIEQILPNKVKLDFVYIDNPNFFKDLAYILAGIKETVVGTISKKHIINNRSQIYMFFADLFITISSYIFAHNLNPLNSGGEGDPKRFFSILSLVISVRFCCYIYFGMYRSFIRYISYHEIIGVFKAVITSSLLLVISAHFIELKDYGYSNFIALVDGIFLILFLAGLRLGLRFYWERKRDNNTEVRQKRRILVYGAGDVGFKAYKETSTKNSPYKIVGYIADEPEKYGKALNGVKVLGNRYHIRDLAKLYHIDEILITEQIDNPSDILEIIKICQDSKLKCRIFPSVDNIDSGNRFNPIVRNLEFSDLLPLKQIHADHIAVKKVIAGKVVLINGSGGALGLELCRKILHYGCSRLIILDRYESYLNEAVTGLLKSCSNPNIIPVLIDTDKTRMLEDLFKRYRPDIVIQAGMRKYKPVFDVQLEKTYRTYYRYTLNLAKLAVTHKCGFFVMISSLMAYQDGSLITDLLRKAEVRLSQIFKNSDTCLIISRLPDIAENRGGIVSLLEEQIINQGTVILPAEETRCCLITKYSAAEFILQNIVDQKNKLSDECIFNCDAGFTVSFIEIIQRLASYHGLDPWTDLEVKYIGQSDETLSLAPQII
jgi:FlaA1/EpsC-like NDP-sugar epimerase/lipopolysaccharide/colanic/teichoic acid biosynthesis glycosyltransferase